MSAGTLGRAFAVLLIASQIYGQATLARVKAPSTPSAPLTIPPGAALHVIVEKPVRIDRAGATVEGRVRESVFVVDRVAIPAGSRILGRVSSVEGVSRKRRVLAMANGDFTPLRQASVDFDALVLKDGTRVPLHVMVSEGVPSVVHLTAGGNGKKRKGRIRGTVEQVEQQAKDEVHQTVTMVTAPGKWQRLKAAIQAELPYHRQWITAGTQFTAELAAPVELANTEPGAALPVLWRPGGEIPAGSLMHALLATPLSSATDKVGSAVQAVVSEPLFSSDRRLIVPAGTRLEGSVTEVRHARRLHRSGRLRFTFRKIELLPGEPLLKVETSLESVDTAGGANLKLDAEGGAHGVTPKTNFIAPAIDVVLALGSLDGLDPYRRLDTDFRQGPDTAGGAVRGGAGFGLIGTVIGLAAHSRPVSAGFAFYGAAWSVYSHLLARGNEVVFLKHTPIEIRFGPHEGPAPPDKMLVSGEASSASSK